MTTTTQRMNRPLSVETKICECGWRLPAAIALYVRDEAAAAGIPKELKFGVFCPQCGRQWFQCGGRFERVPGPEVN